MSTINLTGTVTDTSGASASFSASASTDQVSIVSSAVTPQVAAPGTLRTLSVLAQSTAQLAMTATVISDQGPSFVITQVANPTPPQPLQPGQQFFQWTFTL